MKAPTIYDIKEKVRETQPYFFTCKSMKFFGQTLKDFRVRVSPRGNTYIYAPSYWDNRLMGYTFRQVVDNDLVNVHLEDSKSKDAILEYIKGH